MTSIVKRVFRSGSGKKHGSKKDKDSQRSPGGRRKSIPQKPPSPDLSGLNLDEISILKDVLKRQQEFESKEIERKEKLRESLQTYEEEVKKSASQKSKLKQVDIRLCRLCYTTKFADGIGKACYDCHKRVCNRCGSFSRPKWNAKKNKSVKGKWRCSMCQMKRDMAAMTGVWYHGNDDEPAVPTSKIQKKLSTTEIESSENDVTCLYSGTDFTYEDDSLGKHSSDVFSSGPVSSPRVSRPGGRRSSKSSFKRRSASQSEMEPDDMEEEIDGEQFQRERQMYRIQRHNRRSRRRLRSGSGSFSNSEQNKESATDSDRMFDASADSDKYNDMSGSDRYCEQPTDSDNKNRRVSRNSSVEKRHSNNRSSNVYHAMQRDRKLKLQKSYDGNSITGRESDRESPSCRENRPDRYHNIKRDTYRGRSQESSIEREYRRKSDRSVERNKSRERRKIKEQRSGEKSHYCNKLGKEPNQKTNVPFKNDNQSNHKKPSSNDGAQNRTKESHISQTERESRHARSSRTSRESCTSRDSHCSRDSYVSQGSHETSQEPSSRGVRLLRQSATYFSSSSSVFSDSRCTEQPVSVLETGAFEKPATSPSKEATQQNDIDERNIAQKLNLSRRRESRLVDVSSNSLSPNMALDRHRRVKQRKQQNGDSSSPGRSGSASPKRFSDNEPSIARVNDATRDSHGRRMTLPHCDNVLIPNKRKLNSMNSSRPHEIILHRDKLDSSVRTNGLGMRVVGGRTGPGGTLGAYVTLVTKSGPADVQGISEGDQVIEWNGRSLVDVTFEEAQEIISQSRNIFQISVIHSITDRSSNPTIRSKHPIIIRADTLGSSEIGCDTHQQDNLILNKPKRRMLPKTPVEIKRDVKKISGSVWMQLDYDMKCQCLLIVLNRGEGILSQGGEDRRGPNPLAMLHLLPNRTLHEAKESELKFNTTDPDWNETFVFPDISEDEVNDLALEVTIWNFKEVEDEFLGEVLLDLSEATIDNTPICYHLEDHDDNSSPLPYRKKSFSLSDQSAISPVTSLDASSCYPSRNPSPRSSVSTKADSQRTLPTTPAHDKMKELIGVNRRSPGRDKDVSSSAQSSPLHSPISPANEFSKSSFASLVKKRICVVARLSSSLIMGHHEKHERRLSDSAFSRSQSYNDVSNIKSLDVPSSSAHPRRSFELCRDRYDLLAPPHPLSNSNSSSEFYGVGQDGDPMGITDPNRPAPEGDDITSLLGPGQVAPKPSFETNVSGDIKMGFMVSKGQLEIDIVVVKGLVKSGLANAPDTYVKTYLVEGSKTVQKKKTQTVRMSFDPIFRKTIKYSACNIHGRCIKVNVWEKQKAFDKKLCLGEAVVKLDNLDLSQHTMAWYKLFPVGATEFGSTESLNYWGYQ